MWVCHFQAIELSLLVHKYVLIQRNMDQKPLLIDAQEYGEKTEVYFESDYYFA